MTGQGCQYRCRTATLLPERSTARVLQSGTAGEAQSTSPTCTRGHALNLTRPAYGSHTSKQSWPSWRGPRGAASSGTSVTDLFVTDTVCGASLAVSGLR